jgi:hypothetical protein
VERRYQGLIWVLSQHLLGGTEKNNEKLQDSQPVDRGFNPGASEYEVGLLTSQPRGTF